MGNYLLMKINKDNLATWAKNQLSVTLTSNQKTQSKRTLVKILKTWMMLSQIAKI